VRDDPGKSTAKIAEARTAHARPGDLESGEPSGNKARVLYSAITNNCEKPLAKSRERRRDWFGGLSGQPRSPYGAIVHREGHE
jgi:hypothetical protein